MGIVIEGLPQLTAGECSRAGLFRGRGRRSVGVQWERGEPPGRPVLSATITAETSGAASVTIAYRYKGREQVQTVGVCSRAANYGRGRLETLFVCPVTGRSCRKLYFVGGRFVSRYAFRGRYLMQTVTERRRLYLSAWEAERAENALLDEPGRRLMYAGKPTRYARQIEAAKAKARELSILARFEML